MLAAVHGTHAPMRLEMEQAILSQFQRLPGLKSNFVGLETLLGRDEEIDFGDYLGSMCC
jgi:proteasome maturation protein